MKKAYEQEQRNSIQFANRKGITSGVVGSIRCPEYISIGEGTSFGDWIFLTAWDSYDYIVDGKKVE